MNESMPSYNIVDIMYAMIQELQIANRHLEIISLMVKEEKKEAYFEKKKKEYEEWVKAGAEVTQTAPELDPSALEVDPDEIFVLKKGENGKERKNPNKAGKYKGSNRR